MKKTISIEGTPFQIRANLIGSIKESYIYNIIVKAQDTKTNMFLFLISKRLRRKIQVDHMIFSGNNNYFQFHMSVKKIKNLEEIEEDFDKYINMVYNFIESPYIKLKQLKPSTLKLLGKLAITNELIEELKDGIF